jgi:hypothetical protein
VELPTYTNIWKIEKRLYKLYDFRLPMPLPVGQIVAFLAIAVPYTLILTMAGMPFSHTWLWVYVLPPGLLAWLVTRPVLEGKRLPELMLSQLRYLGEPRTWCRMAPLAEKDEMLVVARAWRSAFRAAPAASPPVPAEDELPADDELPGVVAPEAAPAEVAAVRDVPEQAARGRLEWPEPPARPGPEPPPAPAGARPAWPNAPASTASERPRRGVVQVSAAAGPVRSLNTVERALRSSPAGWKRHEPVVVVPGGHRPGKPDQVQRDQARARLPLPGPARVVVLGCTAGAGQTVVTLLTGQLLASLRGEPVAVLDLGEGQGSLTELARSIPVLLPSVRAGADRAGNRRSAAGERGLQVISAAGSDAGQVIDSVVARYPLVLADTDAAGVPKSLRVSDQLVLVAPASEDAATSLAMTLEWLDAHGYGPLAEAGIIVLNGVSSPTAQHAARATAVASGRCRAIVQVPWDERLAAGQTLGTPTVRAYTALAGLLVAALADSAARSWAR